MSRLRERIRIARGRVLGSRVAGGLAEGVPTAFVAALAAAVLVAILYAVATKKGDEPRGYAEVTLTRNGCAIDRTRQLNATLCTRVSPGVYRVTFSRSLAGSTVVASLGSCCPGRIGASAASERAAIVALAPRRVRRPVRATVLVP